MNSLMNQEHILIGSEIIVDSSPNWIVLLWFKLITTYDEDNQSISGLYGTNHQR